MTGEAGSGKTFLITEKIRSFAANGRKVTVIVPEQFSSDAEHKFYNALGISLFNKIKVETFSRIKYLAQKRRTFRKCSR